MAQATQAQSQPVSVLRSPFLSTLWAWLGVVPFFLFAILFLIVPSLFFIVGSFQDSQGNFTFKNIVDLFQPSILNSYILSIQVSAVTALGGGIFGFLLAYAAILGGLPKWLRTSLMTFSGVASNFAGVPLAFSFMATMGRTGFLTALVNNLFGLNLYQAGFNLYNFWGLAVTYMYFQFPLMVLIMAPALDGLKREWREASENLGASAWQYWRHIALPILLPTLLGTTILLFGNAFGAYATAYSLTGSTLPIVTIQIGAQIRGDVLHNQNLGYALALGMVVIMALSMTAYTWLQRRSAKWLR
ncbi:Molybdenum transport system permease protein ModB [Anaerolineae bacterium]|nr:Molybdenum transport system permease protein ModB [Anaerolineae bacterium]